MHYDVILMKLYIKKDKMLELYSLSNSQVNLVAAEKITIIM